MSTCSGKAVPSSEKRADRDSQPGGASPSTNTDRIPSVAAAFFAFSTSGGMVTRYFAADLRSWCASSSDVYNGLIVVAMPPMKATP